jgi:hypothetical protein
MFPDPCYTFLRFFFVLSYMCPALNPPYGNDFLRIRFKSFLHTNTRVALLAIHACTYLTAPDLVATCNYKTIELNK